MARENDPPAPAPGAGELRPPTTGLAHAGVTVRDLDRSLNFYVDGLGLACTSRRRVEDAYIRRIVQVPATTAIDVAMLAVPDGPVVIELLQYHGCERQPGVAQPCDPGSGHLCLFVTDAHAARERALAADGRPRSPQAVTIASGRYAGGVGCYLADPDGYTIELLQPPLGGTVGKDPTR